ncbi:hypothetical protein ACQEVF_44200 [Nonomuraea polychroma]|uniref:hypothetical protein n=1 Tax=Nonomuraea polychroma TaxID=46176 RepID=UPI003D93F6E2
MDYHLLLWTTETDSLAALRALVGQGLLDGVLLMEVQMDDPRIAVLTDADIPFAMIGRTDRTIETDWVDTDSTSACTSPWSIWPPWGISTSFSSTRPRRSSRPGCEPRSGFRRPRSAQPRRWVSTW